MLPRADTIELDAASCCSRWPQRSAAVAGWAAAGTAAVNGRPANALRDAGPRLLGGRSGRRFTRGSWWPRSPRRDPALRIGLLIRSFIRVQTTERGIRFANVLLLQIDLPASYNSRAKTAAFFTKPCSGFARCRACSRPARSATSSSIASPTTASPSRVSRRDCHRIRHRPHRGQRRARLLRGDAHPLLRGRFSRTAISVRRAAGRGDQRGNGATVLAERDPIGKRPCEIRPRPVGETSMEDRRRRRPGHEAATTG